MGAQRGLSRSSSYVPVQAKPWGHEGAIHILEARSMVKIGDRLANVRGLSDQRVLILNDSLAVVLAFSRRRAKDFPCFYRVVAWVPFP